MSYSPGGCRFGMINYDETAAQSPNDWITPSLKPSIQINEGADSSPWLASAVCPEERTRSPNIGTK